jgi:hypothetical protein
MNERVSTFTGLTRRELRIRVNTPFDSIGEAEATISGLVPASADKYTSVFFVRDGFHQGQRHGWLFQETGHYGMHVYWRSPPAEVTGTLYLLRQRTQPDGYDGYATRRVTIQDGVALEGQDFVEDDLIDPPEGRISGTVANAVGDFAWGSLSVDLSMPEAGLNIIDAPLVDRFDLTVPMLEGATFAVSALTGPELTTAGVTGLTAGATGVSLVLPAHTVLVSPPEDATAGVHTVFQWAPNRASGYHTLWISPEISVDSTGVWDPEPMRFFAVHLQGTQASIPDLTAHGLGLLPASAYRWQVEWASPRALDDRFAPHPVQRTVSSWQWQSSNSESRRFCLGPGSAAP